MIRLFQQLGFLFALAIIFIGSMHFALLPGKLWHSAIFPVHFLTSSLVSAQIIEPFRGFSKVYIEPRLGFHYSPNNFEDIVSLCLIGLVAVLFFIKGFAVDEGGINYGR